MKKKLLLLAAFSILFNGVFAEGLSGKITVAGSSALLPLTLAAKKNLKDNNPNLEIAASGQGSTTGIQAVQNSSANIAV